MKMCLISDNVDTLRGMRLAGVEGIIAHEKHEAEDALAMFSKDKNVAIILVTEKIVGLIPEKIKEMKLTGKSSLILEIPDRHGYSRGADFITRYIREAIGLKI